MRVGCILNCGHNFLILLDFYVHSLLSGEREYTDEPLADEEWLKEYEQQQA